MGGFRVKRVWCFNKVFFGFRVGSPLGWKGPGFFRVLQLV